MADEKRIWWTNYWLFMICTALWTIFWRLVQITHLIEKAVSDVQ